MNQSYQINENNLFRQSTDKNDFMSKECKCQWVQIIG